MAAIAGLVAAAGAAYAANQANNAAGSARLPKVSLAKLQSQAPLLWIQQHFPEMLEQFRLTRNRRKSVDSGFGGLQPLTSGGYVDKKHSKTLAKTGTANQVPKSQRVKLGGQLYRIPTSAEIDGIVAKINERNERDFQLTQERLASRPLLAETFRRAQGDLGAFGREIDRATADAIKRTIGGAAASGTLDNPAVLARILGPQSFARAQYMDDLVQRNRQVALGLVEADPGRSTALRSPLTQSGLLGLAQGVAGQNAQIGSINAANMLSAAGFGASAIGGAGTALAGILGQQNAPGINLHLGGGPPPEVYYDSGGQPHNLFTL